MAKSYVTDSFMVSQERNLASPKLSSQLTRAMVALNVPLPGIGKPTQASPRLEARAFVHISSIWSPSIIRTIGQSLFQRWLFKLLTLLVFSLEIQKYQVGS